jgi:hypothetical protein
MFLTPSDFTGKYELHTGMYVNEKIIDYINRYEKRYLVQLFGEKLYNEFVNDIDPLTKEPKSPNFIKLFTPFVYDVTLYETLISEGILDMLKGFIYFEYSKDNFNQQTVYGNVQQKAENSKVVNTLQTLIYNRYNEAITTFRAIRDYIYLNYDEPLGQVVEVNQTGNNGQTYVNAINVNTQFVGSGNVTTTTVTNVGTGYANNTNVATSTAGSGTGLTVDYTDDGAGGVDTVTIVNPGSGYVVGDIVTILDGNVDATLTIDSATPLITGPGTGLTVDIEANGIGGVDGFVLLTPGTGYIDGVFTLSNGTGSGFELSVTADLTTGEITGVVEVINGGSGYSVNDVLTLDGGNLDATFEVLTLTNGAITSVIINQQGVNYSIGDVVTINGGDGLAEIELTYVGVGNYGVYNGKQKQYAYWL